MAQFYINELLNKQFNTIEELKKSLFEKGILTKDYPEDGLVLLYHKFDTPANTDIQRECRSLVINRDTKQIVSYTCDVPIMNSKGFSYLLKTQSNDKPVLFTHCYEGTLLSLFHFNSKWYLSTRRCLDSNDSVLTGCDVSHYDMFNQVLELDGLTFDTFVAQLDTTKSYYFVLIHHLNKHLIDYSNCFGDNYKKLCLITIRDNYMNEVDYHTLDKPYLSSNIFLPMQYSSLEPFNNACSEMNFKSTPLDEGIVCRVWNNDMNRFNLIKLQQPNYIYNFLLKQKNGEYKANLFLYQSNKLDNPKLVSSIHSTLTICTSEFFELFKVCYSLKTGKHLLNDVYNKLPLSYKTMLYGLRGLYFKNKFNDKEMQNLPWLKIHDIYNFLKDTQSELLVLFLEERNKFRTYLINHPEELVNVTRTSKYFNLSLYEQSNNFVKLLSN
jgi:hypothetical protein